MENAMLDDSAFWAQVAPPNEKGCMLWTGPQWGGAEGDRYGQYTDGRWNYYAHRFAFSVKVGPIPVGARVCHSCDNRLCCTPGHMFLGTHGENMADMYEKGRGRKAKGEESGKSKLTAKQVLEVYNDPRTYAEIAAAYNVGLTCVGNIKRGETWGHLTQHKAA
jgi:hypothetical protein